ncbi:hypothetical protein [Chryseobacterium sp.]|uniref:hypothetical protein n=1 Tax=Chryseobacterium sp. TaxID=1871047 RepID=UPI0011CB7325|nr:hypothetical protein [Chryseobacterium sp.]TXF75114.1 hypothetical protein FUA25_12665 [Chryseobacterium sp.]
MTKFKLKLETFAICLLAVFFGVRTFAQESAPDLKVDVDVDKGGAMGGDWMSSPLVWVIGALVLILIIALVARGNNNK